MTNDSQAPIQGKKGRSGLEALADEASDYGKALIGAVPAGAAAAHFWANSSLAPALAPVLAFPLGHFIETKIARKQEDVKSTPGTYAKEPWLGLALTPLVLAGYKAVSSAPAMLGLEGMVNLMGQSISVGSLAVGGLAFGILTPTLIAGYISLKHLFDEGTFKGIGENFKKHYLKGLVRTLPLNIISSAAIMDAYSGYTWTNYLTTSAASYLTSFLAPYLAISPMMVLGLGVGALALGYRLALSKYDLNYFKILNPLNWTPLPEMVSGSLSVLYKGVKGFFNIAYETGRTLSFSGSAPQRAVPQPAH